MINRFWNGIIERAARRYGRPGPAETTERVVQERFTKPTGKPGKISSLDQLTSVWDSRNTLSWVIPDLLAEGSLNLLSAASGTGKTWFAYFLAGAVAHGNRVFGKEVQPRLVLYNDRENPLFVVKQRLSDLGIGRTPNLKIWGGWEEDPPPGPDHPLVRAAAKEGAFIIWDSLIRFNPGDEQSSTDTSDFMEHFRHLAHLGATILILHHTGKSVTSQDYRGSSDIPAAVDMAYKLEDANESNPNLDDLLLTQFKSRFAPVPRQRLTYVPGSGFTSKIVGGTAQTKPSPVDVVIEIVRANPGMKQGQIIEQAKGKVGKDKVVDTLKDSNVFRCEGGTGHTKRYWLKEPEEMASEAEPENPVPEEPVPEQPPLPGQAPPLEPVSCLIF